MDAVIICTPSILHYDVCKLAGENGIAVFCEKPFTTSSAQAIKLADLFEGMELVNQVGYVYRFDVVFNKVKEYLEAGLIGNICHVNAQFLSATISSDKPAKGWRAKRENGGGAIYEMGSHLFDLMNFFWVSRLCSMVHCLIRFTQIALRMYALLICSIMVRSLARCT